VSEDSVLPNPEVDAAIDSFMQGIKCVGGTRGIVYVTVPITSGYRAFELMETLKCSNQELREKHKDRHDAEVVQPNLLSASSWAQLARNAFPDRVVLDPSQFFRKGWGQPEYYRLWKQVIEAYADTVIATPNWPYSLGSRAEVEMAINAQLRVVDLTGDEFTVDELLAADAHARNHLRNEWGWKHERIEAEIPRLSVNIDSKPPKEVSDVHWYEIFRWIHDDMVRYQESSEPVYTPQRDDDRTRLAPTSPDSWRRWRLEHYWSKALIAGVDTPAGRTELAKLAVVAVSYLRSAVRVYGPLASHVAMRSSRWYQAQVKASTVNYENRAQLTQINTEVWTWLIAERSEARETHPDNQDDMWTQRLVESPNQQATPWNGELWGLYLQKAEQEGLHSLKGRYHLGQFATAVLRLLESSVRLYGPIPNRTNS
jgi:hypothetical protein